MSIKPSVPNKRAALDAAVAFSLLFGREWRRASEPERSRADLSRGLSITKTKLSNECDLA